VPFRGRNHSGATQQNFLWRLGNVFVMDNHRAAMWCWLQCLDAHHPIGLLHINEHYDTLYSRMFEWLNALPPLDDVSIETYLSLRFEIGRESVPLIQWDNYLSLFLERYAARIQRSVFATHGVGDEPRVKNALKVEPQHLPGNIEFWMRSPTENWLVNVDLDYFFCDQEGGRRLMFSDDYIEAGFDALRRMRARGKIACLTICLSPDEELTSGWEQAEALCARLCAHLGVPFQLSADPRH
jgi:hypothetical protein